MQFDTGIVITMFDGTPVKSPPTATELTIGAAAINALLADDGASGGQDKFDRFMLAQRLHEAKGGKVALKAEDAALIKNVVGSVYGALIVGQVWQAIDGDESAPSRQSEGKAKAKSNGDISVN